MNSLIRSVIIVIPSIIMGYIAQDIIGYGGIEVAALVAVMFYEAHLADLDNQKPQP